MIQIENLHKSYQQKKALQGISFQVKKGEIFGLLGPNGAGKTTTIKILTGQLTRDSGRAEILNRDVLSGREELQYRLGIVPEETNLYERLSVEKNLKFFCQLYGVDFSRINKYLEHVGMSEEKDTVISELSKGMKQKVLLVRALLHDPELLFLDEPTSGLDPASAEGIHRLLEDLKEEGKTILLTSHNMEEVDRLCHRVAFLDHGVIVAQDTPEKLKLAHAPREVEVMIETEQGREKRRLSLLEQENASLIKKWIEEERLITIHSCEPGLTEIFVKVTGRELT